MKARVTRPDGTGAEIEGTADEVANVLKVLMGVSFYMSPGINLPSVFRQVFTNDMCGAGGAHEYQTPYIGDGHPPCRKCGNSIPWDFSILPESQSF